MKKLHGIKALAFDAYGTVFDVHSVVTLAEEMFPGKGKELSQLWRSKQIEYMFLRTIMGRYIPHDQNTEAGL
jgi:2-haloacid dehalogenase